MLCWGASPFHLSQSGFEVARDDLQSSDKRTFLKETVDYCREDVRFAFNGNQSVLRLACTSAIKLIPPISCQCRKDNDRSVCEAVVL